jgi:hypothetical protein
MTIEHNFAKHSHHIHIKKTKKDVHIGTIIKNKIFDLMVKHDFQ